MSKQLLAIRTSRISATVQDVTNIHAINPWTHTHPIGLDGLNALLETISFYARRCDQNDQYRRSRLNTVIHAFNLIASNFRKSCRTRELAGQVYICARDVAKLINSAERKGIYPIEERYKIFTELQILLPDGTLEYIVHHFQCSPE